MGVIVLDFRGRNNTAHYQPNPLTAARTRAMIRKLSPAERIAYHRLLSDQLERPIIEIVPVRGTTLGHYLPF